jgi:phospholipase/carboxylesterase
MTPADLSLIHRIEEPREKADPPYPALILLHGRGADEEDLLGLAPSLDGRLLMVSARAPYPFPASGGFTWYDMDAAGTPEPSMFRTSIDRLGAFLHDLPHHYPVDPLGLYLLGFSMGAVMCFALALTQPHIVRGVVAHSGYIAEGTPLDYRWSDLRHTPFFVAHGTFDPVIPVSHGKKAVDLLSRAGAQFTYREYPIGHQISNESLLDIAAWLDHRLSASLPGVPR